jgi:hypothetical protein
MARPGIASWLPWVVLAVGLAPSGPALASVPTGSRIELFPIAGATLYATYVVVSPDGLHVYVGAQFDLQGFQRDPSTGVLAVAPVEVESGNRAAVAISPDGAHGNDEPPFRVDVAISPDGRSVWVTSAADDTVTRFARDAGTGSLTPTDGVVLSELQQLPPPHIAHPDALGVGVSDEVAWISSSRGPGPQPTSTGTLALIALALREPARARSKGSTRSSRTRAPGPAQRTWRSHPTSGTSTSAASSRACGARRWCRSRVPPPWPPPRWQRSPRCTDALAAERTPGFRSYP